ncbi:Putative thioredoxin-2 [Pigmentiphaga humi]|uniref:Thioredoxin-2 n=1 Tax=Pigmentiphaga humi TaxID=2478468 RepID=A0A3P4B7D9_9BURK|nr:thioredoxin family protein [Pigmentiphaga humi]VCU72193.1 Putative thioredoxin-2 [Pigmentiphaga humi]
MAVYLPDADARELSRRLDDPQTVMVACLCAAWCGTCREYRPRLEALSGQFPDHVFLWVDVEEHPDLLDDEDIEDFPTLLVQDGHQTLFYGPMLPHIEHLQRLLTTLQNDSPAPNLPGAPELRRALI